MYLDLEQKVSKVVNLIGAHVELGSTGYNSESIVPQKELIFTGFHVLKGQKG